MQANGGAEVQDWKRGSGSRMVGDGAEAGEEEVPACKVNDLQSSTDKFNSKKGLITRLRASENAVGANSLTQASERVDQTMQGAATDGAGSDAAEGSAPLQGVGELLRCNRAPVSPQPVEASEVFGC